MSKVIVFDEFGGPEVLRVVDDAMRDPDPGEVRLRIEAFATNPLDSMLRRGVLPVPVRLPGARTGIEATGVVDATGAGVTTFSPGDHVIVTSVPDSDVRGVAAEFAYLPSGSLMRRPEGLTTLEAAAVWVRFSTAYGALLVVGGLEPGHTVLVSGASGAVGRAALQIAARIGADAIALTRNPTKTAALHAAGATAVVEAGREDIASAVLARTGRRGADVVLDLVRGPGQRELLAATRAGGTLIEAGFLDERPTLPVSDDSVRVIGYRGFDHLGDQTVVSDMAAFLAEGIADGMFLPLVGPVFDLGHVADAYRRMESGGGFSGKVVVTT